MARKRAIPKPDQARQIAEALEGRRLSDAVAGLPTLARHFSPDEHIAWVEANCFRSVKGRGWAPLRYCDWQRDAIRSAFAVDDDGLLIARTISVCLPRRWGKSEITGLYDLHRADAYADQLIVIQGNSEDQGLDTVMKTITDTLWNSPALRRRLASFYGQQMSRDGDIFVATGVISFMRNGSTIKVQPAKESTAYGQKIHVYHNTEACRAADQKIFDVGASSTGDAWCGVSIVDSNMGDATNLVARFVELSQLARAEREAAAAAGRPADPSVGDPTIRAIYVRFEDLAECLRETARLAPWIDQAWLRGRYAQMTRGEFLRNHCNQAAGEGQTLWSVEQIDPLFRDDVPMFAPKSLSEIVRRLGGDPALGVAVGVGLDRAGAFSRLPDRTVLAAVLRLVVKALVGKAIPVFDERGEQIGTEVTDGSIYALLAAWEYMRALRDPIQAKLLDIDRAWRIGRFRAEAYQASDLVEWCQGQTFGKRCELVSMTARAKQALVTFSHGLVVTRRFVAPAGYEVLRQELLRYREVAAASGAGVPSYAGKRATMALDLPADALIQGSIGMASMRTRRIETWVKDDYAEAVFWAISAARDAELRLPSISAGGPATVPGWL